MTISFDEFKNKVKALDISLKTEWCSGGISGGSCWDSSNPQPYTSDEVEPKDTAILEIIKELYPNISGLKILELLNVENLYEYGGYTSYEYYGNRDEYRTKELNLVVLYNMLEK